jgi:hypothetical protein
VPGIATSRAPIFPVAVVAAPDAALTATGFADETALEATLKAELRSAPPAVAATLCALETTELASRVAESAAVFAMLKALETTELAC